MARLRDGVDERAARTKADALFQQFVPDALVGPDFARTTGMRLLAGRDIEWSDIDAGRRVAVVNEKWRATFSDARRRGEKRGSEH